MSLAIGRRLGPYEIVSPLGSGGMGEVYEARDTRLQRRVALKTLRPDLLADPHARRRFEREARALSALSHPNICTVFDFGHDDGVDFIVMEYIEGKTLAALLDRAVLPEPVLVRYAEQIAEALAEAHEHGVLHRDIKPQNVMVTSRGRVKVLDFGLAKAVGADGSTQAATASALSDAAVVVGTAPYMAPEQVRGEAVDARSDAFSLGSLLYEAFGGRPPFRAPTAAETMAAILTADPVPLGRIAPATSPELQRIVRKCLEKDPSRRYQTLRDVATDLENLRRDSTSTAGAAIPRPLEATTSPARSGWLRPQVVAAAGIAALLLLVAATAGGLRLFTPPAPAIRSMAVLPLKPIASGSTENYLGLGIADAVITRLSGTPNLMVRPTSAVRRYADDEAEALRAGSELQVDAVLDGTWQRESDRLRVTVNLLRVVDGTSLWADRFDLPSHDIFAIQDRVSDELASRLRLELDSASAGEGSRDRRGTRNPDAYDAYLRGQFYLSIRGYSAATRQDTDRAAELFRRALSLDPDYAEAHAKLGFAYAHTALFHENSPALIEQAKRATAAAERIRPDLGQIALNRGLILWSWYEGWQIVEAIRQYRQAESRDPALTDIELAAGYAHLGLFDEWRRVSSRILDRDPTNRSMRATVVNEHFLLNLPEEGRRAQKRLLNEEPDERYFLLTRRVADAAPLVEKEAAHDVPNGYAISDLALLRALQGRATEADALARRAATVVQRNRGYHHVTYTLARVAALRGDGEEAARWLKETIDWGFPCYPMFSTDSFLDRVRTSRAVQEVLSNLRVRWESYRDALQ